ncbi:MAG: septal ring lytic transglycosylase RlpA family protein [Moraxellaceae bacterium]|mgnify:FL=1|jgi:rare lipoprotein A|nr:septal ring lytic transglycosylase RlpA family protein [Moraxellaceae bacterium]MBK9185794.1 septal ring lytic transglycosylase RlpA family protein [Moraxellaceae bacterium]MBL0230466.1 septal ring lytic transglycosylase RlpA family protein [Moraxellaceae bacterium]MCC6374441.1 septal ring lytic transglycosylase RlpA family protein [Moraxellaceae bacterium]HQV79868.1 septal ring lytic transglycosylase RlpA family protein [Agitococcus sp.]
MTSRNLNKRNTALLSILLTACLTGSATAGNTIYFSTLSNSNADAINELVNAKQPATNNLSDSTTLNANEEIPEAEPFVQSDLQYTVSGKRYTVLAKAKNFKQVGLASWYGKKFHGRTTASGEEYDMHELTAAHKTLPIPCYARVTNQENGKSVIVKINDRGPFHSSRILDVSKSAAAKLGMLKKGTTKIKLEVISSADDERSVIAANEPAPAPQVPQFFVQVGSFSSEGNALNLQNKLSSLIALPIEVTNAHNNAAIHKVQIGPFVDEATAKKASQYVLQVAALNPVVIRQ